VKSVTSADDTNVLLTARNDKELTVKINGALDFMIRWFSVNGLTLNKEKT
jgi:hypothetical protein